MPTPATFRALCAFGLALAAGSSALAEGQAPALSFGESAAPRTLYFTALTGVQSRATYLGSDETATSFFLSPSPVYLGFGKVRLGTPTFKDDPRARPAGFGIGGAFNFIAGRNAEDFDALDGLDDIDPTVELGVSLSYGLPNAEGFAEIRYGLGGSDGWVAELGADLVARPNDRLALRFGPRFLYGSDNFVDTYFGVSEAEAQTSAFNAYAPEGGLVSAGVEVSATYRLGERWWLEGRARYDRYQDDAAESPIVQDGSEGATSVMIGVRRSFVLEF